MSVFEQLTKDYKIPKMVKVRQNFPRPVLDDIPGTIKNELQQAAGNEYLDYTMRHGSLLLGHAHPLLAQAS